MKSLDEMTLYELWQLFPIILTEHNSEWENWYGEEESFLKSVLPAGVEFYHIGSTAIRNICAKPIIDILGIADSDDLSAVSDILEKSGYRVMSREENRISLNKGYTQNGFAERVFHLHLRHEGDTDEIFFRDYLRAHPDVAKEYEKLKLKLGEKYKYDRDAYTNAKSEFIRRINSYNPTKAD